MVSWCSLSKGWLYSTYGWPPKKEKKWVDMSAGARRTFAESAVNLLCKHSEEIRCMAIVVRKEDVPQVRRQDANLLYNYMARQLLLAEMAKHRTVYLSPDVRSIKVESGSTFKDYLQTELFYSACADTILYCQHTNSASCKEIQFVDMLAGAVGSFYEFGQSQAYGLLKDHVALQALCFPARYPEAG